MNPSTQVMAWPRVCLEGPGVVPEVDSYPKDNLFLPWTWAPVWNIQSLYMPGGGSQRFQGEVLPVGERSPQDFISPPAKAMALPSRGAWGA